MDQPGTVKGIRDSRLNSYKATPRDIRGHYRREVEESSNYQGRPILELLQNAEDALLTGNEAQDGSVLIRMNNGELFVANQGTPFSWRGFQSLCDDSDSPKRDKGFIGNKGTGFKAVLQWSEHPEIHSGEIHARFDRDEAKEKIFHHIGPDWIETLKKEEPAWDENMVPLLRVPLDAEPDDQTEKLLRDFATVIRLPLKEDKFAEVVSVIKGLKDAQERQSLLFLRHLRKLRIEMDGSSNEEIEVYREGATQVQDGIKYQEILIACRQVDNLACYKLWRRTINHETPGTAEVAIALPLDDLDNLPNARLFNFFPTRKASPLKRLPVHATFHLKPDRNDLKEDDPEYHDLLIENLAELLRQHIIPEAVKKFGPRSLYLLEPGTESDDEESTVHRLHKAFISQLSSTPFIPALDGTPIKPEEARLWDWGLGSLLLGQAVQVEDGYLVHPDWQEDGKKEILKVLGARELPPYGHIEALRHLKPKSLEDGVKALNIVVSALEKLKNDESRAQVQVKKLNLWLTEKGRWRSLDDSITFFKEKEKDFDIPDWMNIDFLHKDYANELKKDERLQLKDITGPRIHEFTKNNFVEKAILPLIKKGNDQWWKDHMCDLLQILLNSGIKSEDENPWASNDENRKELAKNFFLIDQQGELKPAWKFYAGQDWDNQWAEKVVESLSDRYLLGATDFFPQKEHEKLIPLFKYLGVSFGPKWIGI